MLNKDKELFTEDQSCRDMNKILVGTCIDQLIMENLTLEEKQKIADTAKEATANNAKFEEENAKWWYKYGKNKGEVKGMFEAIGLFTVGYVVGVLFRKKR